jgi:signal transduction histidine kinase
MSDATLVGRGQLGRGLSFFGATVLCWSPIVQYVRGGIPLWILIGALAANVAWAILNIRFVPTRVIGYLCTAVMIVGGALTAAALEGDSLVAAAAAVLWVTRDARRPTWHGLVLGVITGVLVIVGDVLAPVSLLGIIALEAGVFVGFLAGLSRRQFVLAEVRARELVEEHARSDVLTARTQLASEIHDVLAHSLGGLVIQLDAVDALLESGGTVAARAKVHDARALAAEGLSEARRAVAALSETPADSSALVGADQVLADVTALVRAHDSLGGRVNLRQVGVGHDVSKRVELALRRAAQEGLTNARKHAPDVRVDVVLTWTADSVQLQITNPVGPSTRNVAGGHGLVGMRERFAALPGGSASAGRTGKHFVVTVKAQTAEWRENGDDVNMRTA